MRSVVLLLFIVIIAVKATEADAQTIKPQPLPENTGSNQQTDDRVRDMGIKAAKILLKAKLFKEKRKLFNRDNELIAKLEIAVEFDELIEALIEKKIDAFQAKYKSSELGDGELLKQWIEFWSSPEFEQFITQVLRIVEKIFELIGPLLMDFEQPHEMWVTMPPKVKLVRDPYFIAA